MRATVIVPAHDEEAVLGRCLDALHAGAEPGEWDVVVAANGCTDRTVEVARAHPSRPRVLDLPAPGKTAALNAADAVAATFPRVYLDADIEVDAATLRGVVAVLEEPGALVAAPAARLRTEGCSPLVRSYYRVWADLPFLRERPVGSGLFALSREGHARVAPFPDVVAEDEYVRRSFTAAERRRAPGTFDVRVARTVRALVRRGTRTRAGNRQLAAVEGLATGPGGGSTARFVLARARHPRHLPDALVFLGVTLAVRVLAAAKRRRGDTRWERDDSTRERPSAGSATSARPASPAAAPAPVPAPVPAPTSAPTPAPTPAAGSHEGDAR